MLFKGAVPPSRIGKKQVITFVDPALAAAIIAKAEDEGKTLQELIAEAMNKACELHGRSPIFSTGHSRVVRRRRARAGIRDASNAAKCRVGRRQVSGWFDKNLVQEAVEFSKEKAIPIQKMLEIGFRQICGLDDYRNKL